MLNSVPKLWKFTILHRIINKSIIHSLVVSVHSLRENLEPLQMFSPSNKYKYFIHKFAMLNAYKLLWCLQLRMKMYSMSVFRITYLLRTLLHQYRQAVIRAHHYRNQRHAKTENNDKSRKPTQTNKEIDKKNCSNFHANARKINHRLNVWRKAVAMTRTTEARRTDWQATQSDRSNYSTRSTLHHMCMDAASVLILFTKPHVIVFGSDDGVHIEPANAVTSSSRNFSRPTCAASAPVQSEQKIKLNVDMY